MITVHRDPYINGQIEYHRHVAAYQSAAAREQAANPQPDMIPAEIWQASSADHYALVRQTLGITDTETS